MQLDFDTIDYDPPLPQDYDSLAPTAHDRLEYLRMCCCQNELPLLLTEEQQATIASDLALLLHRNVDEHRKALVAELDALVEKIDPAESLHADDPLMPISERIRDLAAHLSLGGYGYE